MRPRDAFGTRLSTSMAARLPDVRAPSMWSPPSTLPQRMKSSFRCATMDTMLVVAHCADDGLVTDLSQMLGIYVDPGERTVCVGGGATFGGNTPMAKLILTFRQRLALAAQPETQTSPATTPQTNYVWISSLPSRLPSQRSWSLTGDPTVYDPNLWQDVHALIAQLGAANARLFWSAATPSAPADKACFALRRGSRSPGRRCRGHRPATLPTFLIPPAIRSRVRSRRSPRARSGAAPPGSSFPAPVRSAERRRRTLYGKAGSGPAGRAARVGSSGASP